ncbi:MAG: hypothetical protein CSA18_03080 [Deltaproteobacteria bacterium]|nr:MAG: hypothetical protein CSA18_03080 [Deltaproteobacteria bacterium]
MAGFDPDKDKVLKEWRSEETGLVISINQYAGGEPKLQIGPRIIMKKDGTEGAPRRAGRLSVEDVMWLYDIIDDIKDDLQGFSLPE